MAIDGQNPAAARRRPPKFELVAESLCLDFVNTLDNRHAEKQNELLKRYVDLARFGEDTGTLDPHLVDTLFTLSQESPEEAERALRAGVQLREAIYTIIWAIVNKRTPVETALFTLNQYVQVAAQHAKLVQRNGRFEWQFDKLPNLQAPLWPIARSAADLLASDQLGLVRACSSKACQWLFLDTTKNHRRTWCDMKVCGNRAKGKRYYAAKKEHDPDRRVRRKRSR